MGGKGSLTLRESEDSSGRESCGAKEVSAMVTKLLSRAEMLSSPEALEAVRQEAAGLRSAPVWGEENPREFADVQTQAPHRN